MSRDPDLLARYLPVYDVSDTAACVVEADLSTTWQALLDADLIEVGRKRPTVAALGFTRMLPELARHLLRGERIQKAPERLRLREMGNLAADEGGWTLLGEIAESELALGLVGKFWRPVIEYAHVETERFASFAEPGWAKTIYDLRVEPITVERTLLTGTMRTQATDGHARRWFRRYWILGVGSGAHVLVNGLLEVVREAAEAKTPAGASA